MKPKILIIAPYHNINDYRVIRSIKALDEFELICVFEQRFFELNEDPRYHFFNLKTIASIPCIKNWLKNMKNLIENADLVYIHESGIIGLAIVKYIKKRYIKKVVFDYHDHLPFELKYQLGKIHIKKIWPIIYFLFSSYYKKCFNYLDGLVCISEGQKKWVMKSRYYDRSILVVENTRKEICINKNESNVFELLWIGNLRNGRNIEGLLEIFNKRDDIKIKIFGEVSDTFINTEDNYKNIVFYGKFKDDVEIANNISKKAIGVLQGWPDDETSINAIASPNKLYTYINLEIPIIVESKLFDISEKINKWKIGHTYKDEDSLYKSYCEIINNYDDYQNNVKEYKKQFNDNTSIIELKHYIKSILSKK